MQSMPDWFPDFAAWTPNDWSALGTIITAAVAIVAGFVAWRQLREARRLRLEQAQPYVVCFAERTAGHDQVQHVAREPGVRTQL